MKIRKREHRKRIYYGIHADSTTVTIRKLTSTTVEASVADNRAFRLFLLSIMTTSCVLCIYLSVKRWSVLTVRDTSAACMMRSRLHRVHHKVDFLCTVFVNSVLDLFSSLWEAPPESCFREFPGPRTGWPGCLEKWVDANPKIRVEEGMDAPVWVKTRMRRVEIPDPDGGIWRSIFGHYT